MTDLPILAEHQARVLLTIPYPLSCCCACFPHRLVHRLDRRVSGVMMLARSADAAAWLAACFRDKAAQALQELEDERLAARSRLGLTETPPRAPLPPRELLPGGLSLARTYWALLHGGRLKPGERGRITLPVPVPGGGGPSRPAVTLYRVRASKEGLSWVELTPMTGARMGGGLPCSVC